MERFDRTGVSQRGRNLGVAQIIVRDEAVARAKEFQKVATVIRPDRNGPYLHAVNQAWGVGREDDIADTFFHPGANK